MPTEEPAISNAASEVMPPSELGGIITKGLCYLRGFFWRQIERRPVEATN